MTDHRHSFFQQRQMLLMAGASAYVILLILSHSTLPALHVWLIAAVFSIVMNLPYAWEAFWQRRFISLEVGVSLTLIVASLLGVFVSPLFVIAAIFGHGLWDLAKHRGAGVPFVAWYNLSCFVVDLTYGVSLLVYWMQRA